MPENSQKMAKKAKKSKKSKKKYQKRAILHSKICPLEMIIFVCFPTHLLGLSERYVLDPQTLIGDSVFMEIWLKQNSPFSQFSSKISIFSLIKSWSKRSLKIAPKRRLLRKKLIKSTLKYTDRGAFFDLGVKEAPAILQPKSSKFALFGIFEKTKNGKH